MPSPRHIVLLPGDGIGPEVVAQARRVLEAVADTFERSFTFEEQQVGHAAIEATGDPLPAATLEACRQADAILLGAVGHPRYEAEPGLPVRPEQGLLRLRRALALFANLRPVRLFDELLEASTLKAEVVRGTDILFFRELTGGIYFGEPRGRDDAGRRAYDTMTYSIEEVRRIARMAFEAARRRRRVVHSIDKANVLETSRLWRETVTATARAYPEVALHHMYVDNAAMQLIRDPRQFDVVLTSNLFGDILTDEAAQLTGSLGMLPSAATGAEVSLYEPVHGSAPELAGRDEANPLATILSAGLMLEHSFGWSEEAQAVVDAVARFLEAGWRTADLATPHTPADKVVGTSRTGQLVAQYVRQAVSHA